MNKEAGFDRRISQEIPINPEDVWGSDFRIVEIVANGTGKDFKITGLNLPREWELKLDNLKAISPQRMTDFYTKICSDWDFSLESLKLDPNNVLKEVQIKNNKTNTISKLHLASFPFEEKGIYEAENLTTIDAAFIFQEIGASYLKSIWNENDYAYIGGNRISMGGGFGPDGLKVPKKYFESQDTVTNSYYQEKFIYNAHNIAGRFGLDLLDLGFNDRGILNFVSVQGDRTTYALENRNDPKYHSHNVDTPEQAAVLHNIVASHINFLLEKDNY